MLTQLILGVSQRVQDMNGPALHLDPACERSSPARNRVLLNELPELSGNSEVCRPSVDFAVEPQDLSCVGATESGGVFDESLKHRLKIESRPADDLEDFTGRRLLLQCFGQVTVTLL